MTRRVLLMSSSMRGGGSEQQVLLLLRHLNRDLFEPHLYVLERVGDLLSQVPSDVQVHAFDDTPRASKFYFPGRVFRAMAKHIRQVVDQHQIDVIYDRTFQMTLLASAIARPRVPRVSTIVSPPEYAFPLVEKRFRWWKQRRLQQAYRSSKAVIAVSDLAAESAVRFYGLTRPQITTIANPVDRVRVQHQAAQMQVPVDKERVTLVCVGRMSIEKGHRDLWEAIRLLENDPEVPPLLIQFIGDGPLEREVRHMASTISTRHTAQFLSRQANPAPYIQAASVLVLPSHFEGMPNVVLEAFALSTPVIATRSGGTVELERDEPTIQWAEPNNPRSLAEAIREFCTQPEKIPLRVAAAGRLIERFHDVQTTVQRIESLLA